MSSSIYKKLIKAAGILTAATGAVAAANALMTHRALSMDTTDLRGHYYSWRYGKVYYTKKGQGTPVLFLHGLFPGAGGHLMQPLADALSDSHTVYVLDLPGFGRSDKPLLTYTSFFYVQLLNDFVENVVSSPVSIVADSLSCTFSSIACQTRPGLYSHLLLINPPKPEEENRIPNRSHRLLRHVLELPILGSFLYNIAVSYHRLSASYGHLLTDEELRLCCARAHCHGCRGRYAFASLQSRYMNANISRALTKIDRSVYVVLSGDPDEAQEQIRHLHSLNSSIETEYLRLEPLFPWTQDMDAILEICHFLL